MRKGPFGLLRLSLGSVTRNIFLLLCVSLSLVAIGPSEEPAEGTLQERLAAITAEVEALDASIPHSPKPMLEWDELPELPDPIGVAGPFVGVQVDKDDSANDVLIVAGGANFPTAPGEDLWVVPKQSRVQFGALTGRHVRTKIRK